MDEGKQDQIEHANDEKNVTPREDSEMPSPSYPNASASSPIPPQDRGELAHGASEDEEEGILETLSEESVATGPDAFQEATENVFEVGEQDEPVTEKPLPEQLPAEELQTSPPPRTIGDLKNDIDIQQGKVEKKPGGDDLPLVPLDQEHMIEAERVFIEPDSYHKLLEDARNYSGDRRIFLICGDDLGWGFLGATYLALDLMGRRGSLGTGEDKTDVPAIKIYRRDPRETRSLIDFVMDEHERDKIGVVYIIEDAFRRGITWDDMKDNHLSRLKRELEARQAYIILTVRQDELKRFQQAQYLNTALDVTLGGGKATEHIRDLVNRYLTLYHDNLVPVHMPTRLQKNIKEHLADLSAQFKTPLHVKQFFKKVAELEPSSTWKEVKAVAEKVCLADQISVRHEFQQLPPNAQLYAMLAVLFKDLDRLSVDDLYKQAVSFLRADGDTQLEDYRTYGLDLILEWIHAEDQRGKICFVPETFGEQILESQLRSHHPRLWAIFGSPKGLGELLDAGSFLQLRNPLGIAIGQVYTMTRRLPVAGPQPAIRKPKAGRDSSWTTQVL